MVTFLTMQCSIYLHHSVVHWFDMFKRKHLYEQILRQIVTVIDVKQVHNVNIHWKGIDVSTFCRNIDKMIS